MRKIQNIIITSFIAFVGLLMFAECKVNEADIKGGLPYVRLALADTSLAKTDQVVDIPVETNRPLTVEVESLQGNWISGEVTDGILRLTVRANDLEVERMATLTISTTNRIAVATLSVRQDPSGELTITGDLILKSRTGVAANTYTKTTKNLIIGDVVEIVVQNADKASAASAGVKTTHFGDSLIKVAHSYISDATVDSLTSQIHLIGEKGVIISNTDAIGLPVEMVKANGVHKLYFDYNKLLNLPAVEVMKSMNLTELSLRGNEISDISSLAGCTSLSHLDLGQTEVYDISPILTLHNLKTLSLEGTPIAIPQYEVFREKFSNCFIDTTGIIPAMSPLPLVTISDVEKVSDKSFKITAKVDPKEGGVPTKLGFYVGKKRTIADMQYIEAEYSPTDSTFSATYTGDVLTDNVYFFRGYALNGIGEGYSLIDYYGSITIRENVFLTTQDEIDEFAEKNISHIEGSLFIGKSVDGAGNGRIVAEASDTVVYFEHSDINDLSSLKTLVCVKGGVYIGNTDISDVSMLSNLEKAQTIWVKGNKLDKIPDFSKVTNLETLNISRNTISDISVLLSDTDLVNLYIGDESSPRMETNAIGVLNKLEKMISLKFLDLSGLPIHKWQVDSLKVKLTGCDIRFVAGGRTPYLPMVSNNSVRYTETGVELRGIIDNKGASDIVEYGFYYGKNIKSLTKVKVGESVADGTVFSKEVTVPDQDKYYYQAYAINTKGESQSEVYGEFSLGSINLSERGYANTYIVSNAGRYTFNPHIIGNGHNGIIPGAGFHTETAEISPVSAKLLWEEKEGMISDVQYRSESEDIIFTTNGEEGNALIAVCDVDGVILWSWQIWCTDVPKVQQYVNEMGIFSVLDRNLGATRADMGSGDEWKESVGTLYQWGRKDPFVMDSSLDKAASVQSSAEYYVHNPNVFAHSSEWDVNFTDKFWYSEKKTIYDPCPMGYRIQGHYVTYDLKKKGSFTKGLNVLYDEVNTTWYPATPNYDCFGEYRFTDSYGYVWLSDNKYIVSLDNSRFTSGFNPGRAKGDAYPVRCMKDEGYIDLALPVVSLNEISDITSSSVIIKAEVVNEGHSSVSERGVVVGESAEVTIENGIKYKSDSGVGEFNVNITSLQSFTTYYVKVYAINADGISYSNPKEFTTLYSGEYINLSASGTANSYIVMDNGRNFKFDAKVKGNSLESVGTPESVEVIWETKNNSDSVFVGEIISSVFLAKDGFVEFSIPTKYTPGNALIAVKDAEDVILWSWHIWVVDYNPDEQNQIYPSKVMMMDRNLGSLSNKGGYESNGLYYQWGRKDPFVNSINSSNKAITAPNDVFKLENNITIYGSIEYARSYPYTIIQDDNIRDWLATPNDTLWHEEKTIYDPCPVGWVVPDYNDGIYLSKSHSHHWDDDLCSWDGFSTYFPANLWLASKDEYYDESEEAHTLFYNTDSKSSLLQVRCQREPGLNVRVISSTANVHTVDIIANIKSLGATKISEWGVVIGSGDYPIDWLNINSDQPYVVKSQNDVTEFGNVTINVKDLNANYKYYFRIYAIGERGIEYSDVYSFKTLSLGNNEGVGDEDYEW